MTAIYKLQWLNGKTVLLFSICSLLLSGCYSFKQGYRQLKNDRPEKAAKIFKRKLGHPIWNEGAITFIECIKLRRRDTLTLAELQQSGTALYNVREELNDLPISRKKRKLEEYRVNAHAMDSIRKTIIQPAAVRRVRTDGRISGLDTLLNYFPGWEPRDSLVKFANEMVNKTLSHARKSVLSLNKCYEHPLSLRTDISYDNATRIISSHSNRVRPENYENLLFIEQNIWEIFKGGFPQECDMDRFRNDHPDHPYVHDPWYDEARTALCIDSLKLALAFHAKNPGSIFDSDICQRILCLYSPDVPLDEAEKQRVRDIKSMLELKKKAFAGEISDTAVFFRNLDTLSRKYHRHEELFELILLTVNYFIEAEQPGTARHLIEKFFPYFTPDAGISSPVEYERQLSTQMWFQDYLQIIDAGNTGKRAEPVKAWNTKENEFSAVSWGTGKEVYFVRQDRFGEANQVMRSVFEDQAWSVPEVVHELSDFAQDVEPISINEDGLSLLLRSGGKIWQSRRSYTEFPWSKPDLLPLNLYMATGATFTSDRFTLLVEGIADADWPRTDIFLCRLNRYGLLEKTEKLPAPINSDFDNESHPVPVADGRILYFTSDRPGGMGAADNYIFRLPDAFQFASPNTKGTHMGWRLNTYGEEAGFSFISEYSGKGLFHRSNLRNGDTDIFEVQMPPLPRQKRAFDQEVLIDGCIDEPPLTPILRFAGVVMDENRKPIDGKGGSFIEFMTDYNLRVSRQLIKVDGSYSYTAPVSAKAIRIFPEIPGYYSERDTTHFPAMLSEDVIKQDTFVVTSFQHIRENFALQYCTFFRGTAKFDDENRVSPELVRLAKIARRMGAELDLYGHTDNSGDEGDNFKLSEQRALAVKSFLVNTCGFDKTKITTHGLGSGSPKCLGQSDEDHRCNRRVQIKFKMPALPTKKTPAGATPDVKH